jgi:hypothetical protein
MHIAAHIAAHAPPSARMGLDDDRCRVADAPLRGLSRGDPRHSGHPGWPAGEPACRIPCAAGDAAPATAVG